MLVVAPSVDRLRNPSQFVLQARSLLTGQVVRELIDPGPTVASLWATSTAGNAVSISGSRLSAQGRVHSEGGVRLTGAGPTLTGGLEYGSEVVTSGSAATTSSRKFDPRQGQPTTPDLAAYRPGGSVARNAPAYRAIDPARYVGGVWTPRPGDRLAGVVFADPFRMRA